MKIEKYKWFTLVELIIVITILTILATIAFISFSSYLKSSRDTDRVTTLKNIETGLELHVLKTDSYPMPDNPTEISFSGNSLWYQGYIWDSTTQLLNISKKPQDPLDKWEYIYSINKNKKKFSILGYFEENQAAWYIINSTYANFLNRIPKITSGKEVPILIQTSNNLSISWVSIDVWLEQKDELYDMYYGDVRFTGTWELILTAFIWRNKNLVKFDEHLVGYWDMETLMFDGKLKDITVYGNHAEAKSEWDKAPNTTFKIWAIEWINGKSTYFSDDNYLKIPTNNGKLNVTKWTFSFWFKVDEPVTWEQEIYSKQISTWPDTYSYYFWLNNNATWSYFQAYVKWENGDNWQWANIFPIEVWKWYNAIVVYNENDFRVYSNWKKIIDYAATWLIATWNNSGSDFYIWASQKWADFFTWYIDEVKVWDRVLTDEEVSLINYIK